MNCPIVIPSYKNRPGNLVQKLDQFKNRSVFVFVYENDYEIKNVIDKLMPNWEDLQTNYDDTTYIKCFNEINNIVCSKQKPVSALGEFFI